MSWKDDAIQRLWRFIEPEPNSGCWLWVGQTVNGYGRTRLRGRRMVAHRAMWYLVRGEVLGKLTLDHLCRVRCCVNPYHLEPVSMRENIRRGDNWNRRKILCYRGHVFDVQTPLQRKCSECHRQDQIRYMKKRYVLA